MSKVMIKLRLELDSLGLVSKYDEPVSSTRKPILEAGYVDDSVFAVYGRAASKVSMSCLAAETAAMVFWQYAMKLNFAPRKSECVTMWRGPSSHVARRSLECVEGCIIKCACKAFDFQLRFANKHKHL